MSKHHGKQDVSSVEDTSQEHHRGKRMVSLGSASPFVFPEPLSLKVPKATEQWQFGLLPSGNLWVNVVVCFFYLAKWSTARWQSKVTARRSTDSEKFFLHALCFRLWCEYSLPVIVFANLEKIYPVFAGEPERWTGNFHSFKWRGWEVLHFWHL